MRSRRAAALSRVLVQRRPGSVLISAFFSVNAALF
jgi:hypothetical protein